MGNTLNNKKANGLALLPFLVFIVVYMGAGLYYQFKGVSLAAGMAGKEFPERWKR